MGHEQNSAKTFDSYLAFQINQSLVQSVRIHQMQILRVTNGIRRVSNARRN